MKRLITIAVVLGGVWLFAGGGLQSITDGRDGDPVHNVDSDNPVMNAAQTAAVETLPTFLANVVSNTGEATPAASVKVAFDIGADGVEVIWVGPFSRDDDGFSGALANQPNFMEGLNVGDMVRFEREMIRDWSLQGDDGLLYGHYTTRVIVPDLPADQAASINALLSPDPLPSGWQ